MSLKRLVPLLVVVALLAAACGSNDDPSIGEGSAGEHNDADVEFAQGMIPHHEQAVMMAELAARRGRPIRW